MATQPVEAAASRDPRGWRSAAVRVLANALLVALAYGIAIVGVGMVRTVAWGAPAGPIEAFLLLPVFVLARWLYVLPGLLAVLVMIELAARRVRHARVLTAVVALAPMAWWALTQGCPPCASSQECVVCDISADLAILGTTAVVFAILARLPAAPATTTPDAARAGSEATPAA